MTRADTQDYFEGRESWSWPGASRNAVAGKAGGGLL